MRRVALAAALVSLGIGASSCSRSRVATLPAQFARAGEVRLRFSDGARVPLAFYPRLEVNRAGGVYLEAVRGGIYPHDYAGMYAFDATGRMMASLDQAPVARRDGAVISFAGMRDDGLVVTSHGLLANEAQPEASQLYLVDPNLRTVRSLGPGQVGVLLEGDKIVSPGVTSTPLGSSACRCVRVSDLAGNVLQTFGECPAAAADYFVQQVELAVAPQRIAWMHFRENRLHICAPDGSELGAIDFKPSGYVSLEEARARCGPNADPRQLLETMTLVQCVAISGERALVSFRLRNPAYKEFWRFDSIVEVLDLRNMRPEFDFRTSLRLLGAGPDGAVYWLDSVPTGDSVSHALVTTTLR